ncbi:MAG TPA: hypothetical protein DEG17_08890 [Cyanobacteria bacterium UBA11149]|nr:hypothetical protein [Cyanobacteria bacterium UBA11367]HBE60418.1 hypothetical protein [Cyanobacteria bacterium UBA11366]HBK64154.1 hypothetical protein [Cyanobacteria bacterium UBA11166]HBR75332.1 hypothetical protein [Cyanobacteria bacterium UBA11159]HBS70478.1 hypothetical protein [Cyanobacteria bacterium UBA11153]HBW88971.1 hypothetical protein [Cyanobacteria bacterium UBA11149]HCA97276.1 hypothetical protein [Cyanobacteria bacterium UBA9226]
MFSSTTALTHSELASAIVRNPLLVTPEMTVMDAIAQMSGLRAVCSSSREVDNQIEELHLEARSSCVLVVAGEQLVGILTERDIVRLSTEKQSLKDIVIGDVMTHSLITLQESEFTNLFFAVHLLQQHRIRHLPLLNHRHQIIGLLTNETLRQISRPVDLLRLRQAVEVMTADVVCADPSISLLRIAQLMTNHQVSSVMIVTEQQSTQNKPIKIPVGIITERDFVQFQALNLDLETVPLSSVMSTPVFSVSPDESLWIVQQMMESRFIRRLAVTGSEGELLGIVTQTSILKALNPLELYNLADILDKKVSRLEAEKVQLLANRNIELERQVEGRTNALKAQAERERLISKITTQIRGSLNLPEILNTMVTEVRALLNCDRADIWQFHPDSSVTVLAESIIDWKLKNQGKRIIDCCFYPDNRELFYKGKIRVIEDIYTTEMSKCHRELLIRLQIRSKILVPIFQEDRLWGLLSVVESYTARQWHKEEITLLQQLATQLEIAIKQGTAYQLLENELTERKQTEARLRESEQRYATLAAAAPVGIFRTDTEGNCIYVNRRWSHITGLTSEAATGIGWLEAIHPEDRQEVAREWHLAIQENRPFRLEYRFQRPDGRVTWVFAKAVSESNSDGLITGYVGVVVEITERKQAEAALVQLNAELELKVAQRTADLQESNLKLAHATRLKDEFLANMSHELRTPLNAILGMTEALQDQIFGTINDGQKQALQTIERSGSHLLELINDILELAKIEAGQIELQCKPTGAIQLCHSSLVFVKQQALKKQIHLSEKIAENLPKLLVDERRIKQVLINLLNNAIKFTPEGGKVTLEVTKIGGSASDVHSFIRFTVTDTGIGIAPENMSKLFQPFSQIDSALNRQYGGTGLGLSLVKKIVDMHGGTVAVTSELGVGSSFTIDLPCSNLSLPSPELLNQELLNFEAKFQTKIPGKSPKILLAEDHLANINTISNYLTAKGYQIVLAKNGMEAIYLSQSEQPDLILMDIQMPGMDGLEAIKYIRNDDKLVNIPIIAITALAMTGDREKCLETGANEYLSKPLKLKQLTNLIEQLLAI